MKIAYDDIIGKIRTAIDDVVPEASDSFTDDTDAELWQATQHAVWGLLQTLPLAMMDQRSIYQGSATPQASVDTNGVGYIVLPDDFLRFASLKMKGWRSQVYTLIEPGSEEEKAQRTSWGWGTPDKPRAMLDYHVEQDTQSRTATYVEKRVLRFWTATPKDNATPPFEKDISELNYIPVPTVTDATTGQNPTPATIECALRAEAEQIVINQAAAIFFEGKKEPATAEKFRNL